MQEKRWITTSKPEPLKASFTRWLRFWWRYITLQADESDFDSYRGGFRGTMLEYVEVGPDDPRWEEAGYFETQFIFHPEVFRCAADPMWVELAKGGESSETMETKVFERLN